MSAWHPPCYQRASAYVTDGFGRLLVFDHLDAPDAGTQVPGGGIHADEDPASAVVRELHEESGLTAATVVRKLGETWYVAQPGNVPPGLEEQIHHAFHLRLDTPTPAEAWEWDERSGGDVTLHRFTFRWVTLDEAATVLWPFQAMWLEPLRISLAT